MAEGTRLLEEPRARPIDVEEGLNDASARAARHGDEGDLMRSTIVQAQRVEQCAGVCRLPMHTQRGASTVHLTVPMRPVHVWPVLCILNAAEMRTPTARTCDWAARGTLVQRV